ncbi:MAG: bifunctional DNA-formamidopyrimidine glycosylase/DNA-(apurinic or apyrimidinic site) lyase [Chloroflexaceae bacterium]|nr:bifunctional DNA-formamidopyrimidine glycosylase/DNA-(apurinic or apyrimidinic site) lyase [Chloroflexaceae bacterium]
MPELPEVETIARNLATQLPGCQILAVEKLDWERMVETPSLPLFQSTLPGRCVQGVGRRAKWLLLLLDGGWTLALHLRMSGRVGVSGSNPSADRHTHLVLALDDGRRFLGFRDPRKFGRVRLLDAGGFTKLHTAYGPEPLSDQFRPADLAHILSTHHTRLKPLLLNQAVLAGLGNIYVDEALWLAGLHPLRCSTTLTFTEGSHLHAAIRSVLTAAIQRGGSTLRDYRDGYGERGHNQEYFSVYRRTGQPCPRCGTPIERIRVAQRGTHLCPVCQPAAPATHSPIHPSPPHSPHSH